MDYVLDILIYKEDFCRIGLNEQLIGWGEKMYSQDPPRYSNGFNLLFEWTGDTGYYKRYFNKFIPDNIEIDKFEVLTLIGNNMFELERLINYKQEPLENLLTNEVFILLNKIAKLDCFMIFLIKDEEYIEGQYELGNESELVNVIYDCISYSKSQGLAITKTQT